jgi:hypothetical protein
MADFDELGPQAKEALSWIALGELLNMKHLKGSVGITHPGGGQYDCLNFFDFKGNTLLSINRNGSSVIGMNKKSEFEVQNFWEMVAWSPRNAARLISSEMTSVDYSEPDSDRMVQALTVNRIAAWLLLHLNRTEYVRAEWGWYDSSYDVGLFGALTNFAVPDSWKALPAPFPHEMWGEDGWAGNIFLLSIKGDFICAVNFLSGEAISPDGSEWSNWPLLAPRGEGESVILAEIITAKKPDGEIVASSTVLPSLRRKFMKHYRQEFIGIELDVDQIFELGTDDFQELIKMWRWAEGYSLSTDSLGDFLD